MSLQTVDTRGGSRDLRSGEGRAGGAPRAALDRVWRDFRVGRVFRADATTMLRSGSPVLLALLSGGWLLPPPRSLFDPAPLRHLLEWRVNFARIRQYLDAGHLDALAITATSFASGEWVSFIDAAQRPRAAAGDGRARGGRRTAHLVPAVRVGLHAAAAGNGLRRGTGAPRGDLCVPRDRRARRFRAGTACPGRAAPRSPPRR